MPCTLRQLATALLLTAASVTACAQIQDPNHMVSGPPKPHTPPRPPSELDDIAWLWHYTQPAPKGSADALLTDPHFLLLLGQAFPQQQALWGKGEPLRQVIPTFTQRYATVTGTANRYFTLDGCVQRLCSAHGMLFVDMRPRKQGETPLMVFIAERWSEQGKSLDQATAPYDLWLFSSRPIDAMTLPAALTDAVATWDKRLAAEGRGVAHIREALLIEPDGSPQPVPAQLTGANHIPPQLDKITPPELGDAQ